MVSARLFRRRHAARIRDQRRMPHRLDRAILERALGAARSGARCAAMAAVDEHLIRRDDGLALLFTPPFDRTPLDPGYIKGYPPGIRENGGQYTHAADGPSWRSRCWARETGPRRCSAMLNPINHTSTRAECSATRWSLTRSRPTSIGRAARRTRRMDLVHGLGGMDVPGWDRRPFSVCAYRATSAADPCIPKQWPRFEIVFRHRIRAL